MVDKPDYNVGTISVTTGTKTVTGVGTFWMSAALNAGDQFGVDGYPLARIASTPTVNGTLLLQDNWRGPTLAAGSSYFIRYQPEGSRLTSETVALRQTLSQDNLMALGSLTLAADKLFYSTSLTTMGMVDFKTWARGFIGAVDSAAAREALGAGAKGKPYVIFGTGQSNFLRESVLTTPWVVPPNLKVWNGGVGSAGTAWVTPPTSTMNVLWAYAAEFAEANPGREVRVIRMAQGGLPIANWMTPPLTPDMYASGVAAVNAALANLGVTKINQFLWWQGENNVSLQSTYEANFETVITRFKTNSWFDLNTPITIFGLASAAVSGNPLHSSMNVLLNKIATNDPSNRMYVDSRSAPASMWDDALHASGDGYQHIGKMAAHNFIYGTNIPNHALVVSQEGGSASLRQDIAGNIRLSVQNLSTDGAARASFGIDGTGGNFSITVGSGTTAAMGYTGVGGFLFDNPTSIGFRVNLVQKASIDADGIKVGASSNDPAASNTAGIAINASGILSMTGINAGPFKLNRQGSDGSVAAFFLNGVVKGSISLTAAAAGSPPITCNYNETSDYRIKTDIEDVSFEVSGPFIDELKPRVFKIGGHEVTGFVAHEFQEVSPISVTGKKDAVEDIGTAIRKKTIVAEQLIKADPDNAIFDDVIIPEQVLPADKIEGITKEETPDGYTWKKTGERPVLQQMQASTSEVMAMVISQIQELRKRVSELEKEKE